MKTTVHIISHSHWDREWYQSFEKHRMKLIELVDNILEKAENDPEFGGFFLDGQTIALDDYLEVRPEKREQVEKCVREGKIQTGPWYILQDEFLTSGEACVRNLQVGMQEAARYGAIGNVGYFPDAFGNAGQMPQVLKQAGMDAVVIAADTVVALDGAVLGKPADELEAFKMLSTLSGCRHQVYTGLTVLRGEERHTVSEETTVAFRELSEEEISCYIQTGEPMDKAGAYGIQGFGALLIEGIQGDYYNVMGLPVCRLGGILRQLGVDCLRLAAGERDSD